MKRYIKYFTETPGLRIVFLCVVAFLSGTIYLGLRSAEEMKQVISKDFNDQQLSFAHHAASVLEQSFKLLKRELLTLSLSPSIQYIESVAWPNRMKVTLSSVEDYGVFRIMLVDGSGTHAYSMTYNQALHIDKKDFSQSPLFLWCQRQTSKNQIFMSAVMEDVGANSEPGLIMTLATPVYQISPDEAHPVPTQKFAGALVFFLNTARLAEKFVRPIRSGRTGYGWVIDESGTFLYHQENRFVGRDAFEARKYKDSHISFAQINAIQKDKMLQGEEGTSWYLSGWHRGKTGTIRKLIAYAPVHIGAANARRIWSVAVVAPISEVEDAIHALYVRQALIQGVFLSAVVLLLGFFIVNERTWLKKLKQEVTEKTKDLEGYAQRLERSQKRYRALVESADDMIFTLTKTLEIRSMNETWKRLSGQEPDEVIGASIVKIMTFDDPDEVSQAIEDALAQRRSISQEHHVILGDRKYWLDTKYTPFSSYDDGEEGTPVVLVIARDITEQKEIENQLINTEKLASLGSLSAGIAHEINNPIAIILGFSEVLRDRFQSDSKEQQIIQAIERQGEKCKKIVENLLVFARIPGKGAMETNVVDDLKRVLDVVQNSLLTQKIDLKLDIDENLPKVKADGLQLEQVFLNIINNAAAAMEKGGVLTIYVFRSDLFVVVSFKDTGHGIPRKNRGRVFEPFFTTKEVGKGTGLGLSVSYGIVKKFGGEIDVESRTQEESVLPGTIVSVYLPILNNGEETGRNDSKKAKEKS